MTAITSEELYRAFYAKNRPVKKLPFHYYRCYSIYQLFNNGGRRCITEALEEEIAQRWKNLVLDSKENLQILSNVVYELDMHEFYAKLRNFTRENGLTSAPMATESYNQGVLQWKEGLDDGDYCPLAAEKELAQMHQKLQAAEASMVQRVMGRIAASKQRTFTAEEIHQMLMDTTPSAPSTRKHQQETPASKKMN